MNVHPCKMDVRFSGGLMAFARMLSEQHHPSLCGTGRSSRTLLSEDEKAIQKKEQEERKRASWKDTPEVFEKERRKLSCHGGRQSLTLPGTGENLYRNLSAGKHHDSVQTSIRKPELIENSTVGVAGTVTVKKTQSVLYGNTPEVSKAVSTTAVPQEDDFFVEAVPPEKTGRTRYRNRWPYNCFRTAHGIVRVHQSRAPGTGISKIPSS